MKKNINSKIDSIENKIDYYLRVDIISLIYFEFL